MAVDPANSADSARRPTARQHSSESWSAMRYRRPRKQSGTSATATAAERDEVRERWVLCPLRNTLKQRVLRGVNLAELGTTAGMHLAVRHPRRAGYRAAVAARLVRRRLGTAAKDKKVLHRRRLATAKVPWRAGGCVGSGGPWQRRLVDRCPQANCQQRAVAHVLSNAMDGCIVTDCLGVFRACEAIRG